MRTSRLIEYRVPWTLRGFEAGAKTADILRRHRASRASYDK